ncbi:recombination protein RecR [Chlorobium phaeovibrioides]|uniref:Recombination protein RecR n=1 Tax=Chlorobium phaeovibrioides TaxID=1094 RepID=A0A3S0P0I5_CHLPH|nr:recombination mediator RecR [Chlorobium phaeovibrioides]KAA6232718.1 recombination protein RecR [Chlorobium phaeovibrioides]MWV54852.1 recombination protein RecR [Chlorobium phaeovibrioides]QEQ56889.1 recombination protein RecR [Chlorobium phaeovibrioides]RTY37343.1 recombination protein RecR [Chlorobium phaeovibrioides]RTY39838.1 recombination protein RecR [Chlorobium phaeovibrioides]
MRYTSAAIEALIDAFAKLPGVGRKTARRLAMHVLQQPRLEAERLASALLDAKDLVVRCSICQNVTDRDADPCRICTGQGRDQSVICVVESPVDVLAFEKTAHYKGLYHVLHGVISPLDGIGPDDINIRELLQRLQPEKGGEVREIVLALNPTVEGETTSLYLSRLIAPLGIMVTKIARGIPVGAELEFIDEATLSRAMEGRTTF